MAVLLFQIPDIFSINCSYWVKKTCYIRFIAFVTACTIILVLYLIMLVLFVVYRKQFNQIVKKKLCERKQKNESISANETKNSPYDIVVKYCDEDEEFVLKDVVPVLRCHNMNLLMKPTKNVSNKHNFVKSLTQCVKDACKYKTVVVFSPNYLTSTYSHVNIKKIHGEMLKAENTVYVFVDIGPENSIYAFLKEQRDESTSVLWSEVDFWNQILSMLSDDRKKRVGAVSKKVDSKIPSKMFKAAKSKLPGNISFSKLPDWSPLYNVNPFSHSHV